MLLLLHTLAVCLAAHAQGRLLDQPMQIKKLSMSVKADCFTAVTFIEMEFFNHRQQEIEGLFRFSLQPGQVITAFQLDLNGKFRDGSIEEKWKATNAYNTIVGKRIDPALITQEYKDHYRLNIYPVPARSSRRITMTIHEQLVKQNGRLSYKFDFNRQDTAQEFELRIKTSGCNPAHTENGMIQHQAFVFDFDGMQVLDRKLKKQSLNQPISFSLEAASNLYCVQQQESKTFFAARVTHSVPEVLTINPKKLLVYWDASGSALKRNLAREISFLKQYMQRHQTEILTLIPFGERAADPRTFYPQKNRDWMDLIYKLSYDGVTRMDQLHLGNKDHDAVMVFSDGFLSYGAAMPEAAYKPLYTVSTSLHRDTVFLKNLPGNSGGRYIDLSRFTVPEAIAQSSLTYNKLLDVQSSTGGAVYEFSQLHNEWLLYGELQKDDTLTFIYGNRQMEHTRKQVLLRKNGGCRAWGVNRLGMLQHLPNKNSNWQDLLEFGLLEKIVTQNTAYIVLERIEDYIKYQITPPKELEAACAEQGYITKSPQSRRQMLRERGTASIINGVLNNYNNQLHLYGNNTNSISLIGREVDAGTNLVMSSPQQTELAGNLNGMTAMEEVVVVGYGTMRKTAVSGSVSYYNTKQFVGSNDLSQVLAGRVPGLSVSPPAGTIPGATGSISIRGFNSISGSNQPLFVLNGIPIDGNINDLVSVNDIESITVLKDASSAALYGSRGVNGVILITSKKFRPGYDHSSYKLRDMEDEDYLVRLKETSGQMKWIVYQEMRMEYGEHPNYYLDVAQHFFESGLVSQAGSIIMNAAEVSNGAPAVLRAIAYSYESWKIYDKASEIYRHLLMSDPKNLSNYHDLAWSVYQQGNVEEAVRLLYAGITLNLEEYENYYIPVKSRLLNDMNAMIAIHQDQNDFSFIPKEIIRPMPADLRIVITSNIDRNIYPEIREPGGAVCTDNMNKTKNGGYFSSNYYSNLMDYTIPSAVKGKYRINLNYYGGMNEKMPAMYRIITYRDFGRKNQRLEVKNVIMNNQAGRVEIGEVEW